MAPALIGMPYSAWVQAQYTGSVLHYIDEITGLSHLRCSVTPGPVIRKNKASLSGRDQLVVKVILPRFINKHPLETPQT